jgi:hypothetical protein
MSTCATTPCTWFGVFCDCSDIYPAVPAVHACPADHPARAANRVVFIDLGRAVRNDPMKPILKAPGIKRLKRKYDKLL